MPDLPVPLTRGKSSLATRCCGYLRAGSPARYKILFPFVVRKDYMDEMIIGSRVMPVWLLPIHSCDSDIVRGCCRATLIKPWQASRTLYVCSAATRNAWLTLAERESSPKPVALPSQRGCLSATQS